MEPGSIRNEVGVSCEPDFSKRSHELEIMDDPSVGFEEYKTALQQIALINRLTRAYSPVLRAIARLSSRNRLSSTPVTILDIGSGYGDTLRRIVQWAKKKNISVSCTGIDISPWAEKAAKEVTPESDPISYITANVFEWEPTKAYDLSINSLFTHHLSDSQIVTLIRRMTDHSRLGWFVSDLHRHPVPYYFIKYFVWLAGFNRLLRNDAPLSVARSFTRKEWENLLDQAKLDRSKISIQWYWAFCFNLLYTAYPKI